MGDDGGTNRVHNEFSGGTADNVVMAGRIDHLTITPPVTADTPVDRAALELARMVGAQWRAEAGVRGVLDESALRVRWTLDRGQGEPDTLASAELATAYLALRRRRLVVLGGPGSGKTTSAVLLVLALLAGHPRLAQGDRVPVLLSLASWDPDAEHVHAWAARRIAEEYPRLLRAEFGGPEGPGRLVEAERVLYVLDGLDEIPSHRRTLALQRLNESMPGDTPVVVTCRTDEYQAAVRESDVLRSAAVVRADPVTVEDVVAFLRAAAPAHRAEQWRPVIDALRAEPDGPLAAALASPLMVGLLREVHLTGPADPAVLLDRLLLPDAAAVENHLLDSLVATAFPDAPAPPGRPGPHRRWPARAAKRWLGSVAAGLGGSGGEDIAWWQVGAPAWQRGLAAGVAGAVLSLASSWPLTAAEPEATLVFAGVAAAFYADAATKKRRYVSRRMPRGRTRPWRRPSPGMLLLLAILVALFGLINAAFVSIGARNGHLWAVLIMLPAPLVGLWAAALLDRTATSDDAVTPARSAAKALRRATGAALVIGSLVTFAVVTAVLLVANHVTVKLVVLLPVFGLHVSLVSLLRSQPGRYLLARTVLVVRGRLPWRLTAFLEDAHRRGVLRQAGSVYQFRHARLRERLVHRRAVGRQGGR
ncbi:NACHT domain-containing protein [Kitasatospora sp. NPDC059747]|uniref:NACHT domain-containing protein n=1 Tax=Kitasatospora sp. NPDC059747 TaxID=3346930 RepID=UPI003647CEB2